ncbi:MAG: hypothetical protein ACRD1B_05680 [Thermoanaerobaculia bacterium]
MLKKLSAIISMSLKQATDLQEWLEVGCQEVSGMTNGQRRRLQGVLKSLKEELRLAEERNKP